MLSYQHVFHAGNHADILKHYVLLFVLDSLNKKEKPYTFFDTHSGSGLYDLLDNRCQKTKEAENGILKIISQNASIPEELKRYSDFVTPYISKNLYPGSPEIERQLLRTQDFLVLSELHPKEYENLKNNITSLHSKIQINNRSGWDVLKALTPPVTKRGAVLIDPSYEELQDYTDAANTIQSVIKKWSNGIVMLWYPLLSHRMTEIETMTKLIKGFAKSVNPNMEISDLRLCVSSPDSHREVSLEQVLSDEDKKNPPRLYGSGMLVLNSPWKLEEEAGTVIEFVSKQLWH